MDSTSLEQTCPQGSRTVRVVQEPSGCGEEPSFAPQILGHLRPTEWGVPGYEHFEGIQTVEGLLSIVRSFYSQSSTLPKFGRVSNRVKRSRVSQNPAFQNPRKVFVTLTPSSLRNME